MCDRTGISIRAAAGILFEVGHTVEEVNEILNNMNQPCEGYIYVDELPIKMDEV